MLRQRDPRRHYEDHLAWIRGLPCLVTHIAGVEAAHIRMGGLNYGKRNTGMGEKPHDCWVVPLSPEQHRKQHSMSERRYWDEVGINPILVAALLFCHSGNDHAGWLVISNARDLGRLR